MAPKFKPSAHGSLSFETTIALMKDNEEVETEVTVVYSYTPGSPGKLSGPPEDCYPPEGPEVDIEAVYRTDDETKTDLSSALDESTLDSMREQACSEAEDYDRGQYESAMEDRAEAAREREWDP